MNIFLYSSQTQPETAVSKNKIITLKMNVEIRHATCTKSKTQQLEYMS